MDDEAGVRSPSVSRRRSLVPLEEMTRLRALLVDRLAPTDFDEAWGLVDMCIASLLDLIPLGLDLSAGSRSQPSAPQEHGARGPVLFRSGGWGVGQPRVDVIAPAYGDGLIMEMQMEGGVPLHTWLSDGERSALVDVLLTIR